MNRIATLALLAAALIATAPGVADADSITYTTTPFTGGTTTDYTTAFPPGSYSYLPYTNADGSSVTGSFPNDYVQGGTGLAFASFSGPTSLTYTGLPAGTTEVGFTFNTAGSTPGGYLASVEFQGPNSYDATYNAGSTYDLSTTPYMGFISSQAFTTAILTFSLPAGFTQGEISTYTSGIAPSAVPEPSSLAMCGLAGLISSAYVWRRRKRAA